MDVSSPRFGQSLSNAVNHRLVSCSRRGGSLSRYRSLQQSPQTLAPVSVETLVQAKTAALQAEVKPEQRCGRRVAYDSTTVTMSTSANQASYPQHSNQLVGCGFPLAKVVVWFCDNWSSPGLRWPRLPRVNGNWHDSYATLQPDDVVVADSAYGTYVDLALVRSVNADGVFVNIMRVTVIFVAARSWGLAIILSSGSVSAVPSIHECSGFCSVTSKH